MTRFDQCFAVTFQNHGCVDIFCGKDQNHAFGVGEDGRVDCCQSDQSVRGDGLDGQCMEPFRLCSAPEGDRFTAGGYDFDQRFLAPKGDFSGVGLKNSCMGIGRIFSGENAFFPQRFNEAFQDILPFRGLNIG